LTTSLPKTPSPRCVPPCALCHFSLPHTLPLYRPRQSLFRSSHSSQHNNGLSTADWSRRAPRPGLADAFDPPSAVVGSPSPAVV
jgi:hypothetical protein